MNKALFLDRDGVINTRLVGRYVQTPDQFSLITDIVPLLRHAHARGYMLILITNQQGVGKGLMSLEDLDVVHEHMQQCLHQVSAPRIDVIYVCTDLDGQQSTHRKPAPGMLLDAMRDHGINPLESWFVGDSITDAQAGRAAGVKTALVGDFESGDADIVAPSHSMLVHEVVKLL
jgi:D-glycero-D-manno-heptose 1,7-bisphosphate phosphatase